MKKISYKLLYVLWAALFALTVALGFAGVGTAVGLTAAVIFFVPPWLILVKAQDEGAAQHIRQIRWLAAASVALTLVLLCASMMCTGEGEALGNALHAALTVVSAPMICSNIYVVPLFLWGTLISGSFLKK